MPLTPLPKRLYTLLSPRTLANTSVDVRLALAEACIIGLFSALSALMLKEGIGWLGGIRLQLAHTFGAITTLPLWGFTLGWLAGWIVERFSPEASGGGVTQIKAALARFPVALSLRVVLVKILGTIMILGAGFTLGRRGPTVHIGAALAAQLSSWVPTSPEHRRQMIAAGAAAGLAAGFNTPIAGVLFVVEELMRDISGLTLETAIVASVTGAVVSLVLQSADLNLPRSLLELPNISFSPSEIPFYLLLGILAGILGGLFNRGIIWSRLWSRRLNLAASWRLGVTGLISGMAIAWLPPFFRDNAGLREFLVTGQLDWQMTALAFTAHFVLTILAYGAGAPGGLFAPALVLGSALGYLVGDAEAFFSGTGAASTFALAGMGAFFTAVVRVPVTSIVIVFEITGDFNIVLPLMITSAIAYIVADSVSQGSLYEHLLETSGITLTDEAPTHDFLRELRAADVMQSHVETFRSNQPLSEIIPAMSASHHRGFPVVDEGELVGIFTQSDLSKLATVSRDATLSQFMTLRPITVDANASLSDVLYLLNRYQLSRLPVTEEHKLVGIITRTDIIRAEVNQLSGDIPQAAPQIEPSYVVYQAHAPATGQGRILLPLSKLTYAPDLMRIAAAIARERHYELECMQIIHVPKHSLPAQTSVDTKAGRKVMHRAERLGRQWNIPVHTEIRVSQDTVATILEAIHQRHIAMLLLGWKGTTAVKEGIFDHSVDTLIQKVPCELMLVKLGQAPFTAPQQLTQRCNWLVAMAGGPNAAKAIELIPALSKLYDHPQSPQIHLAQVYPPEMTKLDRTLLDQAARLLRQKFHLSVTSVPIRSPSVSEALIQFAQMENCRVVMLGASNETMLQHMIYGNIPEAITRELYCTVILVRGPLEAANFSVAARFNRNLIT